MNTLLLRLAGPLQAWGGESKFEIRRTESFPTKSGVIGFLAAALGRRRDEPLDDLNVLKFGIRIDQPGELIQDFHTARMNDKTSYVTYRYYLSDAVFLVGLESDDKEKLANLIKAMNQPVFPLFLGRRSCPPTLPIILGIRELPLFEALKQEPWLVADWRQKKDRFRLNSKLPIITDAKADSNSSVLQKDLPKSFSPFKREYEYRAISNQGYVEIKNENVETDHDPMEELR